MRGQLSVMVSLGMIYAIGLWAVGLSLGLGVGFPLFGHWRFLFAVGWMFEQKGYITVNKADAKEDELMTLALDIGAEDFRAPADSGEYEIITAPQDFHTVKAKLEEKKIPLASGEITMLPKNEVNIGEDKAEKVLRLMDELEEHEDVQNVYSNFNIPDSVMEKLEK